MSITSWSDEKIIQSIVSGAASKEKAANYLMDNYIHYLPKVSQKIGIDRDQALDAFTDAIMVVMDNIIKGSFQRESKLSSYFYKIFLNKSIDLFRKNSTKKIEYREVLPEITDKNSLVAKKMETNEDLKVLYTYLDKIGEPCRQILIDWGFWGYNMSEIAKRIGLTGSAQAKDRKYRCLKNLRKMMNK